jgi:hypothetical protein
MAATGRHDLLSFWGEDMGVTIEGFLIAPVPGLSTSSQPHQNQEGQNTSKIFHSVSFLSNHQGASFYVFFITRSMYLKLMCPRGLCLHFRHLLPYPEWERLRVLHNTIIISIHLRLARGWPFPHHYFCPSALPRASINTVSIVCKFHTETPVVLIMKPDEYAAKFERNGLLAGFVSRLAWARKFDPRGMKRCGGSW